MQPSSLSNSRTFSSPLKEILYPWSSHSMLLSTSCLYGFAYSGHFIQKESYNLWAFWDWLLSLSTVFSRFFHVVAWVSMLFFLWLNDIPLYGYIPPVFICLFVDRHLCFFHFLAIMYNAPVNIHVQAFVWTYVFNSLEYIP